MHTPPINNTLKKIGFSFPNTTGVYFGSNLVMGFNSYSCEGNYSLNIRMQSTANGLLGGTEAHATGSSSSSSNSSNNNNNDGSNSTIISSNNSGTNTETASVPEKSDLCCRLKNVVPCITTNIKETINCAEGIGVLFPLLAVLTKPQSTSEQDEERHLKSDQDLLINVTNNHTQHTHTHK